MPDEIASLVVQQDQIRYVVFAHGLVLDHCSHRVGFECGKQSRIFDGDGRVDSMMQPLCVSRP